MNRNSRESVGKNKRLPPALADLPTDQLRQAHQFVAWVDKVPQTPMIVRKGRFRLASRLLSGSVSLIDRQHDAYHALAYLQSQPFVDARNVFLVGQSHGGSVALGVAAAPYEAAFPSNPRFRAIVAYYPACDALPTWPREIVSALLVFGAGKDDWVNPQYCVDAMPDVDGAPYEVVIYEEALHGFDLPIPVQELVGHLVGKNSAASDDSQTRMVNWFDSHRRH